MEGGGNQHSKAGHQLQYRPVTSDAKGGNKGGVFVPKQTNKIGGGPPVDGGGSSINEQAIQQLPQLMTAQ
jgi:hypothetical protein